MLLLPTPTQVDKQLCCSDWQTDRVIVICPPTGFGAPGGVTCAADRFSRLSLATLKTNCCTRCEWPFPHPLPHPLNNINCPLRGAINFKCQYSRSQDILQVVLLLDGWQLLALLLRLSRRVLLATEQRHVVGAAANNPTHRNAAASCKCLWTGRFLRQFQCFSVPPRGR